MFQGRTRKRFCKTKVRSEIRPRVLPTTPNVKKALLPTKKAIGVKYRSITQPAQGGNPYNITSERSE